MEGREQVSCVAFQARDPSLSHTCQFFLRFICIIFMHVIHLAAFKNKKKLRKLPKYLGFHGDASLFSTKRTCFWHYVSYWNTLLKCSCSHEHKKNRRPQEYQQIQGCFFCVTASLWWQQRLAKTRQPIREDTFSTSNWRLPVVADWSKVMCDWPKCSQSWWRDQHLCYH